MAEERRMEWPNEIRLQKPPKSSRVRFAPHGPAPGCEANWENETKVYVPRDRGDTPTISGRSLKLPQTAIEHPLFLQEIATETDAWETYVPASKLKEQEERCERLETEKAELRETKHRVRELLYAADREKTFQTERADKLQAEREKLKAVIAKAAERLDLADAAEWGDDFEAEAGEAARELRTALEHEGDS